MVWEGKSVVATGRKIIGATNPLASEPGTIRVPGRRSPCGSLRALQSGGAASTTGSMRPKMCHEWFECRFH
ncbi:unnamed protein product [Triticum turgidum subsp. durum]|uniref:Nucleoside diphosphate kinase-like domain-containing protein n=1 Tax=Triticum turgidum subsp. durum TaxID=4567 RepID=A0A9R0Q985_TRITD|nr:unnamed protein product [Triticum turgidum subsp. durum]